MEKSKGGRPTKFNEEIQHAICAQISRGLYEAEAARVNHIHPDTLIEWKKRYPEFAEALLKAKAQGEADDMLIISDAAITRYGPDGQIVRRGSWQAAAWRRERLQHDKYGMRWAGEITGRGGKDLIPEKPTVDLSKYTDAQIEALIALGSIKPIVQAPTDTNGHNGNGHNGNGH